MMVPLSDAVARRVPEGEIASAESGDLCARIMLVSVRVVVENKSTSPVAGGEEPGVGDVDEDPAAVKGDGTGDGYAR